MTMSVSSTRSFAVSVHGDCSGPRKVTRIRERYDLAEYAHVYAYGDTADDREMLALAHTKCFQCFS